jgi:hypothetical protein
MHVPHLRRKLAVLALVVLAMLVAGIAVGIRSDSPSAPEVDFFEVQKPTFVAETHGIKRMEVWGVPVGSTGEADWNVLGTMKRTSHFLRWASWELPIPPTPGPYMQIMVRAYDERGTEVDRVSLPWIGQRVLREALWGKKN